MLRHEDTFDKEPLSSTSPPPHEELTKQFAKTQVHYHEGAGKHDINQLEGNEERTQQHSLHHFKSHVDIIATPRSYEVLLDLPGFDKNEISLVVRHGHLHISAIRSTDAEKALTKFPSFNASIQQGVQTHIMQEDKTQMENKTRIQQMQSSGDGDKLERPMSEELSLTPLIQSFPGEPPAFCARDESAEQDKQNIEHPIHSAHGPSIPPSEPQSGSSSLNKISTTERGNLPEECFAHTQQNYSLQGQDIPQHIYDPQGGAARKLSITAPPAMPLQTGVGYEKQDRSMEPSSICPGKEAQQWPMFADVPYSGDPPIQKELRQGDTQYRPREKREQDQDTVEKVKSSLKMESKSKSPQEPENVQSSKHQQGMMDRVKSALGMEPTLQKRSAKDQNVPASHSVHTNDQEHGQNKAKSDTDIHGTCFILRTRPCGPFLYERRLPMDINENEIRSQYCDGVLRVHIPRPPSVSTTTILSMTA